MIVYDHDCFICCATKDTLIQCRYCFGHMCDECLSSYVKVNWTKNAAATTASGEVDVACLACNRSLPADVIVGVLSLEARRIFLRVTLQLRESRVYGEAHALLESTLRDLVTRGRLKEMPKLPLVLLEKQLRTQMVGAYMCPRCMHGPMLVDGCDDLRTHHGEIVRPPSAASLWSSSAQRRGGGRNKNALVSNACPACHFLPKNVSDLLAWDGVAREGNAARAQPVAAAAAHHQRAGAASQGRRPRGGASQ